MKSNPSDEPTQEHAAKNGTVPHEHPPITCAADVGDLIYLHLLDERDASIRKTD